MLTNTEGTTTVKSISMNWVLLTFLQTYSIPSEHFCQVQTSSTVSANHKGGGVKHRQRPHGKLHG